MNKENYTKKILNLHRKWLCCGEATERQLWTLRNFGISLRSLSAEGKKPKWPTVNSENTCHQFNSDRVWETARFSRMHYNCSCVHCSCLHTDRMFIKETHNSIYSQGIPGRWSAEGPTFSATLLQCEHLICNNDKSCG